MSVYVDDLKGWPHSAVRHISERWCHMFTDPGNEAELHDMAKRIGLRREWFQDKASIPHYDLTPSRRDRAINLGAAIVNRAVVVETIRAYRALQVQP